MINYSFLRVSESLFFLLFYDELNRFGGFAPILDSKVAFTFGRKNLSEEDLEREARIGR